MGKRWGFGLFILIIILFVVTKKTCLGAGNTSLGCFAEERLALLKLKQSLSDEFGVLSTWVGEDCCSWERVGCDGDTGHVVKLNLRGPRIHYGRKYKRQQEDWYYLVGDEFTLSPLAELKHLNYLDLSRNRFGGSRIPVLIGSLKQLKYLNLFYAHFSGMIPHHLGNLSNLNVLDLSDNHLMEDDVSWVSGLPSLQHLDLTGVDLSRAENTYKVLYKTPSLVELYLSGCGLFVRQLLPPPWPLHNTTILLSKIQRLYLRDNSFQGPFSHFLQNMTSLEVLDLSSNNLTDGPLSSFGNLLNIFPPSLSELHLSCCGLHNTHLSPFLFNFSMLSNIHHLDLSGNSIEGEFPSVLANMSSLTVLDLSANFLNSSIPFMKSLVQLSLQFNDFQHIEEARIWNLCHLKWLDLSGNFIPGLMIGPSADVSKCVQFELEMLDLSRNEFSNSIPESLGRFTILRELHLEDNKFKGPIPASLGKLSDLEVLDLSYNCLVGPIPVSLGELPALKQLDLSSNRLVGPIPVSLGELSALEQLDLSSNQMNGTIPVSLGHPSKLWLLDVSYNSFEGFVFEAHFANLSMLKQLDATSNWMLTFNISRGWMPPFQLTDLLLGSCKIASEFPQWLQNQTKLEVLVLSNASIFGPLPRWFQDFTLVSSLDLSHNLISGPLTNLPCHNLLKTSIEYLFLQNNILNGTIPKSLCKLRYLEYLDISRNRLSGEIPQCLEDLLRVMILGSNQLSGFIPSLLCDRSPNLEWLQLNNNTFQGELPLSMGKCENLYVIDLGENNFSGSIPKWLRENITRLIVLRLQNNKFSGTIPRELCRNSHLQIIDFAHNNLTGDIPHCFAFVGMTEGTNDFPDYYGLQQAMVVVMNGVVYEYTKTLRYIVNMDLSSNHLVGEIPENLTSCSGLMGLNLSHNYLSGAIPNSLGDMKALTSLDLSANKLSGIIPPRIADLNFLSHLNLSNNDLSGRIPSGNQLQTLNDPSIYAGNRDLCGTPLQKNCSTGEYSPTRNNIEKEEAGDEPKKIWFYLDIMAGFATGFWGVIGVLLFKKRWRQILFRFIEDTVDKIYVAIVVRVSKMKRGIGTLMAFDSN